MRILFITANRLGDAVLSTGLLAHVSEQYPDAEITLATGPVPAPLFAAAPGVHRVIAMEKRRFSLHWLSLWLETVGTRWDMVIDLRRSALGWCLMARGRHAVPPPDENLHRVAFIAKTLGLDAEPPAPQLWSTPQASEEAASLLNDDAPVLAIAPAANWRGKQWRSKYFAELATRLTAPTGIFAHARLAVFAAADERDQAQPVLDAMPADRRIDLIGTAGLATLGACLKRCTFFVGNDSGLMHMAAAAGIPTLGLFGPSRETLYAPWGRYGDWVRTPESFEQLTQWPGYDHRTTDTLMDGLTVEAVEAAVAGLWARFTEDAA